jgi:hypothetical protein
MSCCRQWGLSEMAYFIFGYFSTKLVDVHNKIIILSFIDIAKEINGREPILSKICIMANVQENVILHFYFGKTCAKT